jgi:hypothetical protein
MHTSLWTIDLPLLGTIEAGWPSPAEEELTDTMRLDEWLIENREATFMVKAPSNAMIDAGKWCQVGPVRTNVSCAANYACAPQTVPQTFVNGSMLHTL